LAGGKAKHTGSKRRARLRSGFTTGSCAAAAAKAATELLLGLSDGTGVDIPMPGGGRVSFVTVNSMRGARAASAGVIKDAGDDPDVTNGLEIAASAYFNDSASERITVTGGKGVGVATLPGLPVEVGQPAINPVPMRMIKEAVAEALDRAPHWIRPLEINISVTGGEEAAQKTLNSRLGIKGGLSILGTTGIVKPLSREAWQATITSSMDVARAMGQDTVLLSSGRTSERVALKEYGLPDAAGAMMGDHVEFSLREAGQHGFERIIVAAQWAKMLKIAMGTPDTHVRAGALATGKARKFLASLGVELPGRDFNTAREMLGYLGYTEGKDDIIRVCQEAASYGRRVSGIDVKAALVSYDGKVIAESG